MNYLSNELACASLMMDTVTMGGFMWTLSLVPTRRRTVAENLVFVFNTWGGCFSITKELTGKNTLWSSSAPLINFRYSGYFNQGNLEQLEI